MPVSQQEIEDLIKQHPELQKYIDNLVAQKVKKTKARAGSKKKSEDAATVDLHDYSLLKEIKNNPLYKISNRDKKARAMIDEYKAEQKKVMTSKNNITPGQLVLFKYLNPKTQEELEYYDASPCTIFFGIFNSSEGKRVLGFNIHYFPPKLRYIIMDRIFNMYKPVYKKYFETGLPQDMDAFDYSYLTAELERQNLSFAVRMYIPQLIGDTYIVPPKLWPTAVMTEGWFKKETRSRIMQLFKQDAKARGKVSAGAHSKGKAENKKNKRK